MDDRSSKSQDNVFEFKYSTRYITTDGVVGICAWLCLLWLLGLPQASLAVRVTVLLLTMLFVAYCWSLTSANRIRADELGIYWRYGRQWKYVRWDEVEDCVVRRSLVGGHESIDDIALRKGIKTLLRIRRSFPPHEKDRERLLQFITTRLAKSQKMVHESLAIPTARQH